MMPRCGIAAFVLSLLVPLGALASGSGTLADNPELRNIYRAGLQAYHQGRYRTAFEKWRPLALAGIPPAQVFLGFMYDNGQGVEQDSVVAARWYREAAARDSAIAQVRLAILYRDGRGVPRDGITALFWLKLAARRENQMQDTARALAHDIAAGMTAEDVAAAERQFTNRDFLN